MHYFIIWIIFTHSFLYIEFDIGFDSHEYILFFIFRYISEFSQHYWPHHSHVGFYFQSISAIFIPSIPTSYYRQQYRQSSLYFL